jgi:hypothetical protein
MTTNTIHNDGALVQKAVAERTNVINTVQAGFLTDADIEFIGKFAPHHPILVRCGYGRFTCPAQDAAHFIAIITKEGHDYVRDISFPTTGVWIMKAINRGQLTLSFYAEDLSEDYRGLSVGSGGDDEACAITDLLTDVLTFASAHGHDTDKLLSMAGIHVQCEEAGVY